MALKFKATVNEKAMKSVRDKIEDLSEPIDRPTAKILGEAVVRQMKKLIAGGISTIRGKGRFPAYRGSYAERIRKGQVRVNRRNVRKGIRPVNLKLTGDFLKNLQAKVVRVKRGFGAEVGFSKTTEVKKEEGHRKGTNKQNKRPTIPIEKEQFAVKIQDVYLKILNKKIANIAKKR